VVACLFCYALWICSGFLVIMCSCVVFFCVLFGGLVAVLWGFSEAIVVYRGGLMVVWCLSGGYAASAWCHFGGFFVLISLLHGAHLVLGF